MNLQRALWRWPVIQRAATYPFIGPFVISHPGLEVRERDIYVYIYIERESEIARARVVKERGGRNAFLRVAQPPEKAARRSLFSA